jgi:DNA-binding beta-propeller fold protein YncE
MRTWRSVYVGTTVVAVLIGLALSNPFTKATANNSLQAIPRYVVDPFWPKPLPDKWVTGEVGGTCIDSLDHVFTINRGFQATATTPNGLISPETLVAFPSPPVIEYDRDGNVENAWPRDPAVQAMLPNGIHGCFVDFQDNVWIAGNGDGIVQKWSHDGTTLLLQIGTKGVCDTPTGPGTCGNVAQKGSSETLLNQPADIAVDPGNGDVYIADGYGNHRVVVFDKDGKFLRDWGGVGPGPGQFAPGDGGHPHCVVLGPDNLVYACDRGQDRIQVFEKTGVFVREIPVVPGTGTPGLGTAGSAWDVDFSPAAAGLMFEADGGNEVLWLFDRITSTILAGFGRPGHQAGEFTFLHTVTADSLGNLYTGETVGGRRVQKFRLAQNPVPGDKLEFLRPEGNPALRFLHYDPVRN